MTLLQAILLGALQGITEFLPISSSGHLRLAEIWLDARSASLLFDVFLHIATLVAVLLVFRRDLGALLQDLVGRGRGRWRERTGVRQLALLALASVPTAVIGLLFQPLVASRPSLPLVGTLLCANGLILLATKGVAQPGDGTQPEPATSGWGISWAVALAIGLAQGLAVLPGISRSGITIAVALWLGVRWRAAATFSFLLAIPAILGALALQSRDLGLFAPEELGLILGGMVVAGVTGILCLVFLLAVLKRARMYRFGFYCLALGALALSIHLLGRGSL